ncbi:unnamed protein product [Dovyalis caffra]|uniref:Uncharacterized protein n=1 Tax=Dovyalis caffra TaxID=77055 RepID=A0AAV1S2L3_9ROSI|nr:unnamed protein product [Dovyalis caffra]
MYRNLGYHWIRILFYFILSIGAGTLDFGIGTSNKAILAGGKCNELLYGLMSCLFIGALPVLAEEIKVGTRFHNFKEFLHFSFIYVTLSLKLRYLIAKGFAGIMERRGRLCHIQLYLLTPFHHSFIYVALSLKLRYLIAKRFCGHYVEERPSMSYPTLSPHSLSS